MTIQELFDKAVVVDLPPEPYLNDELVKLAEDVRQRGECDLIADFSRVGIVTSSSLSKLLKLRKTLLDWGRRLVLSSVSPATRGIFSVTSLDGVFDMAADKASAIAAVKNAARR